MIKKVFNSILILITLFIVSATVSAQTPDEPVDEVADLTFPVQELGSCTDYKSCLTYCDDPVNHASCLDFAKKKGFYKDDPILAPTDTFWNSANEQLGCSSGAVCLEFCSKEENFDKCDQFAKSQEVIGGYVEQPDKPEYLQVAQATLGCDSAASCSTYCDDPANADKCTSFANQVGLLGGQTSNGPGGCTSGETCGSFCRDPNNFSACAAFAPANTTYTGPGRCSSPESCRSYCEQNPQDCRSYAPGSNGVYVPVSCPTGQYFGPGGVCTRAEDTQAAVGCSQSGGFWEGNRCVEEGNIPIGIHPNVGGAYFQPRPEMGGCQTPGDCYDYCKDNEGKCAGFDSNTERPRDGYIPSLYYTPGTEVKFTPKVDMGGCDSPGSCYDYCKENPGKCQGFDSEAPKPSDTYMPGTYYTPPADYTYFTPPATSFYVTPIYYTPPAGSNYATPQYYTPGIYSTPAYYTPFANSNYTTPNYYTPGEYYPTPTGGAYPTPNYPTPRYYTPPEGSNYTTPSYYTPPTYVTPNYYTPPAGSNYTTPSYVTPPPYNTPTYYTPYSGGSYTTPVYYTPPEGSNYTTPSYGTPSYYYPTPSGSYSYPTPSGSYSYPTPSGSYSYPSPSYATPNYAYPTPGSNYAYPSPSYGTPSYGTPSYPTPASYGTPSYPTPSYGTPSYGTPTYETPSYGTPSYGTPAESYSYPTPSGTQGVSKSRSPLEIFWDNLTRR